MSLIIESLSNLLVRSLEDVLNTSEGLENQDLSLIRSYNCCMHSHLPLTDLLEKSQHQKTLLLLGEGEELLHSSDVCLPCAFLYSCV